ncbi:two pore domain potassium channel family protein [Peribacillus saganii]|uniref:Two pore domain potassium channel family protein n=1 Tax=Peribacillus saganii TaxID=2303992 RepID=A0A372LNR7_9BACI|nr:potassium channel family protein [Peribacillus saganii]RFU67903.1 two pore domain potassium channel family protein [Peribacillus saganii]
MKTKILPGRDFEKKRLTLYAILNIGIIGLLIIYSIFTLKKGIGLYTLLLVLILVLISCLLLLFEFIIYIPQTGANLKNISIGSGLLLSLTILTYANLYYLIYRIKGEKAFSFTGENLSGDDFLYYSITTFTTTGYGDITSIGIFSNALAASEMLIGMITNSILMAVITAKLVKKLQN